MQHEFPNEFKSLGILNGWELVREIGHGGTGVVYELKGERGEKAALKWIHLQKRGGPQNLEFINAHTRLMNEVELQIKLGSEIKQVAAIRDHAVVTSPDGSAIDAFIRMDLLKPLNAWLKERPHSIKEVLEMVKDVSIAVDACHKAGVLHRDIKPENILMDGSGFKLGDFGVAAISGIGDEQTRVTKIYAPPEYIKENIWDEQGDIYAMGLTAYTIFNNDLMPYQESPSREDLNKALSAKREAWQSKHPFYPPPRFAPGDSAKVLCKCTAIDRKDRYTSANEFYNDLVSAIGDNERTLSTLLPYREYSSEPREEGTVSGGVFGHTTDTENYTTRPTMEVLPSAKPLSQKEEPDNDKQKDDSNSTNKNKKKNKFYEDVGIETGNGGKPQEYTVDEGQTTKTDKGRKWLLPLLIALLVAIGIGVYFLFISPEPDNGAHIEPTPTPKPEANFAVNFKSDPAVLSGPAGEYTYYPSKAGYLKETITTEDDETELKGLLPGTEYTFVGTNGGTVTGTTAYRTISAISIRDCEIRLYYCDKTKVYSGDMPNISKLGTASAPSTSQIVLVNAPSQNDTNAYAMKLSISMAIGAEAPEGDAIKLILIPDNGLMCCVDIPIALSSKLSQTYAYDLTALLDELYKRNNGTPEGAFTMNAYLGDVHLGQIRGTISSTPDETE